MRKALLIACALLLWGGIAGAQSSDYIKFYPPAGVSTSTSTPGFSYASNVGSLVNGGTAGVPVPQTFNIYNFCDGAGCATGYSAGSLTASGPSTFDIQTISAGTGPASVDIRLYPKGAGLVNLNSVGIADVNNASFRPFSTDTKELGLSTYLWSSAYFSRSIQGSKSKTLTDAGAAVSFVRIAVPTNGYIGGKVIATANSTDGTNRLTTTSEWYFAGADTAGTVTCGAPSAVGTPATAYRRGNTLVCTMTSVTSTTNCDLQITCTDNLAGDQTPVFEWRLDMPTPNTVTPQ